MKTHPNIISFLTLKSETFFIDTSFTIRQFMEKADFHKFTVVPVLDGEGQYVTSIAEGDILRYVKNVSYFDMKAAENTFIMDIPHYRPYAAVKVSATFETLLHMLISQNFVPVTDDRGVFIGIIKRRTVMEYVAALLENEETSSD